MSKTNTLETVRPKLIIKFTGETEVSTMDDQQVFAAHTGGNTGGSSTPSCTVPLPTW